MPRTSRSVAQRLAAQRSSKKRRPSRSDRSETPPAAQPTAPRAAPSASSGVSVDQILDEVVPSTAGARAAATPTVTQAANRSSARRAVTGAPRAPARPTPVRRRYAEYAAEYQHVWSDLRRILLVAGVLIVLLVVASFFIE
jgi:hypothetical protein